MSNRAIYFLFGALFILLLGAKQIEEDSLILGDGTASDKSIYFNTGDAASRPFFKWDDTAGKIKFSNDGTSEFDIGSGSGGGTGVNVLENGNFESGTSNWTASGGSFATTVVAADVGFGGQTGVWDPDTIGQTLCTTAQVVPNGLETNSCLSRIHYKTITADEYSIKVLTDDPSDLTLAQNLPASSSWTPADSAFTCPTDKSIQICLESLVADASPISLDDAHLGSDFRIGDDAVSLDTQGWHINASIGGSGVSLAPTLNITDYEVADNATLDLVVNPESASVGIACNATEENDVGDLTCDTENENVGVVFDAPYSGVYQACMQFTHSVQVDADEQLRTVFQIMQTPNNDSATITQEGGGKQATALFSPTGTGSNLKSDFPVNVCGLFSLTTGKNTLRLMREQAVANIPDESNILSDRNAALGGRDIHVTVYPFTQNFPQAVALTGLDNETTSFALGGDLTGDSATATKDPDGTVTIFVPVQTHSAGSAPGSTSGIIPVGFRPAATHGNVYYFDATGSNMIEITSVGLIRFRYRSHSGTTVNRTSSIVSGTFSYKAAP